MLAGQSLSGKTEGEADSQERSHESAAAAVSRINQPFQLLGKMPFSIPSYPPKVTGAPFRQV